MAIAHELAFHGEFDISQKAQIEREFEELGETGPHATTILDLTDVGYIDTTFLNALVSIQKRVAHDLIDSHLCVAAGQNVSRVFHITALDRMFPVFASMALAREYAVARLCAGSLLPCEQL